MLVASICPAEKVPAEAPVNAALRSDARTESPRPPLFQGKTPLLTIVLGLSIKNHWVYIPNTIPVSVHGCASSKHFWTNIDIRLEEPNQRTKRIITAGLEPTSLVFIPPNIYSTSLLAELVCCWFIGLNCWIPNAWSSINWQFNCLRQAALNLPLYSKYQCQIRCTTRQR
jgi:hypothetical protein